MLTFVHYIPILNQDMINFVHANEMYYIISFYSWHLGSTNIRCLYFSTSSFIGLDSTCLCFPKSNGICFQSPLSLGIGQYPKKPLVWVIGAGSGIQWLQWLPAIHLPRLFLLSSSLCTTASPPILPQVTVHMPLTEIFLLIDSVSENIGHSSSGHHI